MILLFVLGVCVGVLASSSGLGGGFLVVPALLYLGKEAKIAVGTSFVFILFAGISALVAHYREGNLDLKTGLILAVGGILGAQAGPSLLAMIPERGFRWVFGLFLIATGVAIILKTRV